MGDQLPGKVGSGDAGPVRATDLERQKADRLNGQSPLTLLGDLAVWLIAHGVDHALSLTPRQAIALQASMARLERRQTAIEHLTRLRLARAAQAKQSAFDRIDRDLQQEIGS
ncbi:MAG: hypothetical protein Alpg2KO_00860 [Alphaproteobacteria bacterium]